MNYIKQLHSYRQNAWLEFIDREIIRLGTPQKLAEEGTGSETFNSDKNTREVPGPAFALVKKIARKNTVIKIPGTEACLPAIRKATGAGLRVNVTLLFGVDRYGEVAEAYISGLEDRVSAGKQIGQVESIASFFRGRIELITDPIARQEALTGPGNEMALASERKAFNIYKCMFSSQRWKNLEQKGAHPQRLLLTGPGSQEQR